MTEPTRHIQHKRGSDLLLIVAREPIAGQTKTRLGAAIGMERAALLYSAFLRDLTARFAAEPQARRAYSVGWAFTPAVCDFRGALQEAGCGVLANDILLVAQVGESWGERQANLLRWGLEQGFTRTMLIASDSPQLSRRTIDDAFAALQQEDVALARTLDGGYSLIGMRGYHDVLSGVPMSTASAAEAIALRCGVLGLTLADLPITFDVDEVADLRELYAALAPDGAAAPQSWAALQALGLVRELDLAGVSGGLVRGQGAA